jgi:phosphoheptose isomerase
MTRASETIDPVAMERAGNVLIGAYARGSRMFSCGNGGSASIANHMQCDHLKGIRTGTDLAPQVLSLATNVELLTAIANDIGYHDVFVYQLQSQARPGDVLIAVSSSGRSRNIVDALTWARENGLRTIAITGFGLFHRLMNFGTHPVTGELVMMKSLPGSHPPPDAISLSHWWKPPEKLNPAQNERPAPRSTITFTARSRIASNTAASSSSVIGGTIVFSASGRLSVIVAIGPSVP